MEKKEKCEVCGKEKNVDFTMPMGGLIFTANLCLECSMIIHQDKKMFEGIIRKRAKDRDIEFPTTTDILSKLMKK